MTAAKVMDIVSRLAGCAGQAADAISAYTQGKMEDAPSLFKKSKDGIFQKFGHVYETQMAQIVVQHGRPSRSS